MNERNKKTADTDDQRFATRAKDLFDQSVDDLDANTRSRLNRARHEALTQWKRGARYGQWRRWTPVAGAATVAVVAVVILTGRPPVDDLTPPRELGDFEILLAEESFEMFEELEFYSWIDSEAELDDDQDTNGNVG